MMHDPACETWTVHLRRCYTEIERFTGLGAFVADVLHSWEQELLLNDPEFEEDFHRLLADVADEQAEESPHPNEHRGPRAGCPLCKPLGFSA